MFLVQWNDPTPNNTCDQCSYFVGFIFSHDMALPLPAHPHCECFYTAVLDRTAQPTQWSWDTVPAKTRRRWVLHVAWLLRTNQTVAPVLEPLIPEAEAHNSQRQNQKDNPMPQFRINTYNVPALIDTEKHIIHGASALQAVEALGHRMLVDEIALQQFISLANQKPNGLKSRFTHPGLSSNGMGKLLGRMKNFRQDGDKAIGDIHLSPSAAKSPDGDLREYIESLALHDPDQFGLSIVFEGFRVWKLKNGREVPKADSPDRPPDATTKIPFIRITDVFAVDAVDEPAANRDGLFSTATTNPLAERIYHYLDKALVNLNIQPDQLHGYFDLYRKDKTAVPQQLRDIAKIGVGALSYSNDDIYSFIHRYVLARQKRPLNFSSNKEMIMEHEETEETAVPETNGQQPDGNNVWLAQMQQTTIDNMLATSGLPTPTIQRLSKATYTSPDQVATAIKEAREELAALSDDDIVNLPGRPALTEGMLNTPTDRAESIMEYFFGHPKAKTPPPNFRRFDDLYVAMTGDVNFHGVMNPEHIMFAGATTSTLPNMAANVMNKVIILQWSELAHYRWYERVAWATPNDGSVQNMQWTTLGGIENLPQVNEKGTYQELDMDDVAESDAFVKRGGYVGITLEMIRNSDIMRIQAVTRALPIAAARTRSARCANIFTQNSGVGPTLSQDSTDLFHANHNNIATTAFGTDATAWRAARTECYKHTEVSSDKRLAVFPRYALIPADLYDVALSVFGYGEGMPDVYTPEAMDRGIADPRPVPLAVPEFTDTNDWAYLVDPRVWPVIHISYAQSPAGNQHPLPEVFSVVSPTAGLMFTNDTLPIKVRDWFALGVNGHRGIGKRNVA